MGRETDGQDESAEHWLAYDVTTANKRCRCSSDETINIDGHLYAVETALHAAMNCGPRGSDRN